MSIPLIRAESLSRHYRKDGGIEVRALDQVDIAVHPGEFVAVTGPSGSGKSTLMNLLGCLDRPTGGHLYLAGVEVSALNEEALAGIRNRRLGFVFQSFHLLARTSALENVELPLLYSDRHDLRTMARQALEAVGLPADRHQHHPGELSGGQQQRVAIARAIVNDPEVIFADEPTGNLDTKSSDEIMALFTELNSRGRTVVVVTHDDEVAACARRIVRMQDGRIVSDGPAPGSSPVAAGGEGAS